MTADPTDPTAPTDAGAQADVHRLRRSLDAVSATTPVRPDWEDVVRRADGRGDLALAPLGGRPKRQRVLLAAAVVVAVVVVGAGLVVATTDGEGSDAAVQAGGPRTPSVAPPYAPNPLPDGWEVVDVSGTETRLSPHLSALPLDCPCTVAQWHDGQGRTATYRASQDLIDARKPFQEVVDLGGRANHTLGICPVCDSAGDIGQTLLWATARGRGELTVTGLGAEGHDAPTWFADGPGLALATAVSQADGGVVKRIEGWAPTSPPVEVAADGSRAAATTVTLRTDDGRSLYYEVAPPGLLRNAFTAASPDEVEPTDPARPLLVARVGLSTVGGERFLVAPWAQADVVVLPGAPADDGAPRATEADLRELLASLQPVTPEDWTALLADAGLEDPGPAAGLEDPVERWEDEQATATTTPAAVPGLGAPEAVTSIEGTTPARYLPDPLPTGWSITKVTESELGLGATCPCRLAQWSDGEDTLTYREQAEPLPDGDDDETDPVDLGGGRSAIHDLGAVADVGGRAPGFDRLRWTTDAGHAELVLVAGDDDRLGLADGDGLALARAVAASRGTQVPEGSVFTPAGPPLDLTADQARTSAAFVQLRTASGTLASFRTTIPGVTRWRMDALRPTSGVGRADATFLYADAPAIGADPGDLPEPGLPRAPGPAGGHGEPWEPQRLVVAFGDVDVVLAGIGSVEPGRREEALPATTAELLTLALALHPATEDGWRAFVAAAPS